MGKIKSLISLINDKPPRADFPRVFVQTLLSERADFASLRARHVLIRFTVKARRAKR